MTTMVIVGTGTAGAIAALTLRDEGFDGRIVLIGEQPDEPYRPPLSKDVLRGTMPEEKLFLPPSKTRQDKKVELRTGTLGTSLETARSVVGLDDDSEIGYDQLLLATGGGSRTLPMAPPGTHELRPLENARKLRAVLQPDRHVLIVGGDRLGDRGERPRSTAAWSRCSKQSRPRWPACCPPGSAASTPNSTASAGWACTPRDRPRSTRTRR